MVEEAIKSASVSEVTLSPEIYAEVLERAIAEVKLQVPYSKALFFLRATCNSLYIINICS